MRLHQLKNEGLGAVAHSLLVQICANLFEFKNAGAPTEHHALPCGRAKICKPTIFILQKLDLLRRQ